MRAPVKHATGILSLNVRRFTVAQLNVMREQGIIAETERVELIDGRLMQLRPNTGRHAATVKAVAQAIDAETGDRADVRVRQPVALTTCSEAVPDVMLIRPGTSTDGPVDASDLLLVVEVADRAVRYDRDVRGQLYNVARIPEFWIVYRRHGGVYRYSKPGDTGYSTGEWYGRGLVIGLRDAPGLRFNVAVRDLLG
jgi:hypothetical protein